MVGCLRFLSLPSFSPLVLTLYLLLYSLNMEWCVCKCGWCVSGCLYEHWLWFYTCDSSQPPSTFAVCRPLYYLIISNFFHFSPFCLSFIFFHSPLFSTCRACLYPYQWVQSNQAEGKQGSVITLHSLSPVSAPLRQQQSVESPELNGVSVGSMRKLLFSIARGPFI